MKTFEQYVSDYPYKEASHLAYNFETDAFIKYIKAHRTALLKSSGFHGYGSDLDALFNNVAIDMYNISAGAVIEFASTAKMLCALLEAGAKTVHRKNDIGNELVGKLMVQSLAEELGDDDPDVKKLRALLVAQELEDS